VSTAIPASRSFRTYNDFRNIHSWLDFTRNLNPIHRRLGELGREAREVVCRELNRVLRDLDYSSIVNNYYSYMYGLNSGGQVKPLAPNQVGRLRDHIRENVIRDILTEIDQLVTQLLSTPSQTNHRGSILDFLT
jgi:hypothetical protein